MPAELKKAVSFTKEDIQSVGRKWKAWLAELTPGERAALAAGLAPAGVHIDDVQGYGFIQSIARAG